jgi:hypothetical protein
MKSWANGFFVLCLLGSNLPAQDPPADDEPGAPTGWRERILSSSGGLDWSQYAAVAAGYHTTSVIDYRFGPRCSKFRSSEEEFPLVHQPKPDGIFAINAGAWARINPGSDGDPGAGWMMSGQLLFSPDATTPAAMAAGCANARSADGAISMTDKGLCLRLRAEWTPDWWNRNSISVPTCPAIEAYRRQWPDLTLPPVATARGRGGASVTGFLAFSNGVIGIAGTGNDGYVAAGGDKQLPYVSVRLPRGKVPTALTVTQNNEFVLVTTWDPGAKKGQVAIISVEGRQMAQEKRFYYGLPGGWPHVKGLKLLGFVDLPFAAPMAIDATLDVTLGNPRGNSDNVKDEFSNPAIREVWLGAHKAAGNDGKMFWKQTARFGYAIVSSRAENKVAILNLQPLLAYYRKMYLTTPERHALTLKVGPSKDQWPHTFEYAPEQTPRVVATWSVQQPTTVAVGAARGAFIPPRSFAKDPMCSVKTAYVGTMSGTVRLYDVSALFSETPSQPISSGPFSAFKCGRNPTQIFRGFHSTAPDDLFVVSRGDRSITHADYDGRIRAVLRDRRMKDPVTCFVSLDQAGWGGSGPGKAVYASVLTVMDFAGRQVLDYAVDDGRNSNGEQLPLKDEKGRKVPFIFGFGNPMPGFPFMFTAEEVI